jgi:predicted nucleic acid-binding protein
VNVGGPERGAYLMADVVLLDAGPLGMISHPRVTSEIAVRLAQLVDSGVRVVIPEIADYEVRRELLRAGRNKGIRRLGHLKSTLIYLPITTKAMILAAQFWAEARRRGYPTAHDASLDADVILAGQAAALVEGVVTVASSNPRHLARFVQADHWRQVRP